jgi:hypothetical protein
MDNKHINISSPLFYGQFMDSLSSSVAIRVWSFFGGSHISKWNLAQIPFGCCPFPVHSTQLKPQNCRAVEALNPAQINSSAEVQNMEF